MYSEHLTKCMQTSSQELCSIESAICCGLCHSSNIRCYTTDCMIRHNTNHHSCGNSKIATIRKHIPRHCVLLYFFQPCPDSHLWCGCNYDCIRSISIYTCICEYLCLAPCLMAILVTDKQEQHNWTVNSFVCSETHWLLSVSPAFFHSGILETVCDVFHPMHRTTSNYTIDSINYLVLNDEAMCFLWGRNWISQGYVPKICGSMATLVVNHQTLIITAQLKCYGTGFPPSTKVFPSQFSTHLHLNSYS